MTSNLQSRAGLRGAAGSIKRSLVATCYPSIFRAVHVLNRSDYCIMKGYRHRTEPSYFDDTANADQYQKEVYQYAQRVMENNGFEIVFDVGCGSGFKLIKYLGKFDTTGFDVAATVEFLRSNYPDRKWEITRFDGRNVGAPDLVVCADVIEHVQDPDQLIAFVRALNPKFVIFSTPDRGLMYPRGNAFFFGPPRNPTHLREWSFSEFREYIGQRFDVIDHLVTNRTQWTQMIACVPRHPRGQISAGNGDRRAGIHQDKGDSLEHVLAD